MRHVTGTAGVVPGTTPGERHASQLVTSTLAVKTVILLVGAVVGGGRGARGERASSAEPEREDDAAAVTGTSVAPRPTSSILPKRAHQRAETLRTLSDAATCSIMALPRVGGVSESWLTRQGLAEGTAIVTGTAGQWRVVS